MSRFLGAVLLLALFGAALLLGWPQLFGAERVDWIARVVALRGAGTAVALVLVVLLLLLMPFARRMRGWLGSIVLILLVFAGLNAVVLGSRGVTTGELPAATDDTVAILEWNTEGGAPDPAGFAELIEQSGAEVVSMPETTAAYAASVQQALAEAGDAEWQRFTVAYDEISPARSTSLLIARRLGAYTVDATARTTGQLPTVIARPASGDGPTIVAVHAVAPTDPDGWRSDLDYLRTLCAASDDVIMAGDFNSTLDHWAHLVDGTSRDARLGACADAAETAAAGGGQGGLGTWPTRLPSAEGIRVPALLGSPIDHVVYSSGWSSLGFRVIGGRDDAGSDHRPVLALLRPATPHS